MWLLFIFLLLPPLVLKTSGSHTREQQGRQLSSYDREVLKRINDIEHLPEEDKQHIFYMIDNLVKAVKLKSI